MAVEGLDKLKRKLEAIPLKVRTAAKVAIDQNADELVAMAQRLAPVDDGTVRESIHKEDGKKELQVLVIAGGGKAFYAVHLEHGTAKMAARPFFFPSYRSLRKRFKSRTSRAWRKAIKEVAASGT